MKTLFLIILSCAFTTSALAADSKKTKSTSPWLASLTLEGKQQYQQAIDVLQPMLTSSQAEFALLRQGWLRYLQGQYRQSIFTYQQALKQNPHSLDARLGITLPLLAQKRWREAAKYAKQVIELSPWHYLAHVRLMLAEEGQTHWNALEKHARALSLRYPTETTPLVYLARAYIWQGKPKKAVKTYRRVLSRLPAHIEANNYIRAQAAH